MNGSCNYVFYRSPNNWIESSDVPSLLGTLGKGIHVCICHKGSLPEGLGGMDYSPGKKRSRGFPTEIFQDLLMKTVFFIEDSLTIASSRRTNLTKSTLTCRSVLHYIRAPATRLQFATLTPVQFVFILFIGQKTKHCVQFFYCHI